MMKKTKARHIVFLIGVVVLLVVASYSIYYPSLKFFFAQDDFVFLKRAQNVKSIRGFFELWLTPDHFYRPVPRVGYFVLGYRLFGLDARKFHLMNYSLHVTNSVFIVLLGWRISHNRIIASIAGFLYATHATIPFLVVYWVSGIQDLSATFWALITLLLYLSFRGSKNLKILLLSVFTYLMALLSKEIVVTMPFLIFFIEMINVRGGCLDLRLKEMSAYVFIYFFVVAGYLVLRAQKTTTFIPIEGSYRWNLNLSVIWRNFLAYYSDSLYLRFWVFEGYWIGPLIILVSCLLLMSATRTRNSVLPVAVLGMSWFTFALAPIIFLSQRNYSFYAYFPLIGMVFVLAAFIYMVSSWLLSVFYFLDDVKWYSLFRWGLITVFLLAWLGFSLGAVRRKVSQDPAGILSKSLLAERALHEVLSLYPELPSDSSLYITGVTERDIWAFGHGNLFELYYPEVEVAFMDQLSRSEATQGVYVYRFR